MAAYTIKWQLKTDGSIHQSPSIFSKSYAEKLVEYANLTYKRAIHTMHQVEVTPPYEMLMSSTKTMEVL